MAIANGLAAADRGKALDVVHVVVEPAAVALGAVLQAHVLRVAHVLIEPGVGLFHTLVDLVLVLLHVALLLGQGVKAEEHRSHGSRGHRPGRVARRVVHLAGLGVDRAEIGPASVVQLVTNRDLHALLEDLVRDLDVGLACEPKPKDRVLGVREVGHITGIIPVTGSRAIGNELGGLLHGLAILVSQQDLLHKESSRGAIVLLGLGLAHVLHAAADRLVLPLEAGVQQGG